MPRSHQFARSLRVALLHVPSDVEGAVQSQRFAPAERHIGHHRNDITQTLAISNVAFLFFGA
eukprot:2463477-Pyramimonas_sp.AAC.1